MERFQRRWSPIVRSTTTLLSNGQVSQDLLVALHYLWEVTVEVFQCMCFWTKRAFLVGQMVKNLPAVWETGLISWLGRSLGEGDGNPLQHCCLENPKDRGAWWATIHGVTKSQTRLSDQHVPQKNCSVFSVPFLVILVLFIVFQLLYTYLFIIAN